MKKVAVAVILETGNAVPISGMIDVRDTISRLPHLENFCSVAKLSALISDMVTDQRFQIDQVGISSGGVPIHLVSVGAGPVKALVVAGPHCYEQIGSVTVYSLLHALRTNPDLLNAPVEWNIVPCIDPDGAILNEGWTQRPFDLQSFMRNFYVQPPRRQVDMSFPISHKQLQFNEPTTEARILKELIDRIEPDFYLSLHNYFAAGGMWFPISRDIGTRWYDEIYQLLREEGVSLQTQGPATSTFSAFAPGMVSMPTIRKYYDCLQESGVALPSAFLAGEVGAASGEYLETLNPDALVFVPEPAHCRHPDDGSDEIIEVDMASLKLSVARANLDLCAVLREEWRNTHQDLDPSSPLYTKIFEELVAASSLEDEGGPAVWGLTLQQASVGYPADKLPTVGERFLLLLMGRFKFLCNAYVFVRLLKSSDQTAAIKRAIDRLDPLFNQAIEALDRDLDFGAFEVIDCDTLARVQLGSGLIALNAVIDERQTAGRHSPALVGNSQ